MIWLPTPEVVLRLHQKMIDFSGGSHGIRDMGLIESAVARASAAFGDTEAYPGVVAKAAAMGCGLAQNHGFIDGNKRIGMAVMLLILRRNSVTLHYSQEELIALGLAIARGDADVPDVQDWIELHSVSK